METKASLRGVHLSAQKGRLIADLIRGKKVRFYDGCLRS